MEILNELNRIKNLMNLSEAVTNNPLVNFLTSTVITKFWNNIYLGGTNTKVKSFLDTLDDNTKGAIRAMAEANQITDFATKDLDGLVDELIQAGLDNEATATLISILSKNKNFKNAIISSIKDDKAFSNALTSVFEMEEKGILKRQEVINKLEELYGKEIGQEIYTTMRINFDPSAIAKDAPVVKLTVKNVGDLVTAIDDEEIKSMFNKIGVENLTNFLNEMEAKTAGIPVDKAWFQKELQKILKNVPDEKTKKEILDKLKSFLADPSLKGLGKGLVIGGKYGLIFYSLAIIYAGYKGYNRAYQKELANYFKGKGYSTLNDVNNLKTTNFSEYQRIIAEFNDQDWAKGSGIKGGFGEMVKILPLPSFDSGDELNSLDFGGGSSSSQNQQTPTTPKKGKYD
jgi:hypothetical protein